MLHCWYSYVALLVQLCCTVGIAMLHQQYQAVELFWYRFFLGTVRIELSVNRMALRVRRR